jgi:hypothetical protein
MNAAIEVEGLSHVYGGTGSGARGYFAARARRPLHGDRRPERLRQDFAADDAGRAARADARLDHCLGKPIPQPDPERVGVIFQEASLYPWLTSLENIEFPLSLRGTPKGRDAPPRRSDARARRAHRVRRSAIRTSCRAA